MGKSQYAESMTCICECAHHEPRVIMEGQERVGGGGVQK